MIADGVLSGLANVLAKYDLFLILKYKYSLLFTPFFSSKYSEKSLEQLQVKSLELLACFDMQHQVKFLFQLFFFFFDKKLKKYFFFNHFSSQQ